MPKRSADLFDVSKLEGLMEKRGLGHLTVRKHGTKLFLESGPDGDRDPHARFTKDTVHLWLLDVYAGRKWEPTGFRATLDELVNLMDDAFPWLLAPRD